MTGVGADATLPFGGSLTFLSALAEIPPGYFVVQDQHGANDEDPGRPHADGPRGRRPLFLQALLELGLTSLWTGADRDRRCLRAVRLGRRRPSTTPCARGSRIRTRSDPGDADPKLALLFSCSDARIDRCTNPAPQIVAAGLTAGTIGSHGRDHDGEPDHRHRPFPRRIELPKRCDGSGRHQQAPSIGRAS